MLFRGLAQNVNARIECYAIVGDAHMVDASKHTWFLVGILFVSN